MNKVWAQVVIFVFSISLAFHESWSIYAGSASSIINPSKVKQVSSKPRAYVYEGFLTELECDHLISLDPIVSGIEDKISAWTFLPKENGEDMQVLRYEHGQKYDPHYDYFADKVNIARCGHRIATVLMYLSDVANGGETVFPSAEVWNITSNAFIVIHSGCRKLHLVKPSKENHDLSECAKKRIAVKPRKGDALLFFSLHPKAEPDPISLHGGCPVIEGEKWSATKWIHVDSFDKNLRADGNCLDQNENCERWAALGECAKNSEYMVGTQDLPGYCRRSCKVC